MSAEPVQPSGEDTRPRRFGNGALRGMFLLLLAIAAGCGPSEYRQQVERTRQRLAFLDAERELLDEPVWFTPSDTAVYYLPPRGVSLRPSPRTDSDWLLHYACAEARLLMPDLELLLGLLPRASDEKAAEIVHRHVLDRLRVHADERPLPRSGEPSSEYIATRWSDPPEHRAPVVYRRYPFHTDQERPLWPAPRRAELPHRCTYHYDVYVHDAGAHWAVVVFKLLASRETEAAWRKAEVRSDLLQRIPIREFRAAHVAAEFGGKLEAWQASLATLRVGAPAQERLRLAGRDAK